MCFSQKYQLDPSTAEAFGVLLAAEFAWFQGFTSISLEGDAQEVVRAVHRDDEGRYPFGSLIFDAKEILKSFISWDIGYVARGINGAAHYLARLACSKQLTKIWVDPCPSCLVGIVCAEHHLSDI